ncbi:ATP-dependent RNA helicase DHX33 [Anthonomus grandis grandis]|uniref:ATP-dependent RNA helicase DHX33 n=1 Tax=Anthonomus grandis grandis TaxID=2921223 RepID=UPI00216638FA|nr:ATP-dependent RNA helicase DHX33 [Anthonomus grandis grandis]
MNSEILDSKYNIGNKNNASKISLKLKPTPILFNNKNGPSSPKKMKLSDNGLTKRAITFGNINGNSVRPKISIQEQKRNLPIFANRNKLIDLIKRHRTLIILGEAGSGKTTQIPQYINSARLQENGKIAITQPRRVAAISVALRVAQEYGNGMGVGDYVGYTVRFEDVTSKKTKIKYVTDGMLLREAISDRLLMEYTVVILDEAHERTIHTDVLFGIVKKAQKIREERNLAPLKIIITSATMDVDHFSKYFDNCSVVYLEGRTYPVNIHYTKKPQDDYQTSCVSTFFQIHKNAPPDHDVLIFLTGQEEIETCAHQIRILAKDPEVEGPPVKVCTLYAAQPGTQQMAVFNSAPPGTRKVVISTNIAETSVTISGIKYVIDSGMVKARSYHPSTGLELLKVQRISREQADQRTGRAGRESQGFCYRVYTKSQFELMRKATIPEIQKANLNSVALQLLALNVHMKNFDFMDKPPSEAIDAAFDQLKLLGAVENVDSGELTALGKRMAKFPLDPRLSKVLIMAEKYSCLKEALTIVALLSSESILINPPSKREQAQLSRQKFRSGYGDHITLLNIYRAFENIGKHNVGGWCHEHFVNMRNILYVREVRNQLQEICKKCDIASSSCGSQMDQLRKCLLSGLCMNVAELHRDRQYITLDKRQITQIHPSSVVHGQQPHYVIFTEVVQTTKCYLRDLTTIEGDWLQEVAPNYFKNHRFNLNGNA